VTCDVPVVVFAFNRPDTTAQVIAALRRVEPRQLFLVCDGPRPGVVTDAAACAAVRRELDRVDWPCEVVRLYSEVNHGCTPSVESGLDRVFATVSEAIVLEDDCVPDRSFFAFAAELLSRYRDEPRVVHIAGSVLDVPAGLFGGASYGFAALGSGYGWATWSDRWLEHRRAFPRSGRMQPEKILETTGPLGASRGYAGWVRRSVREGAWNELPWDALLALSAAYRGKLAVVPAVNMVANVGFGPGATHTSRSLDVPHASPMTFPLVHPATVRLDTELARELELEALWFAFGPVSRWWRSRLRPGPVRRWLVRLATSRAAVETYAALGRLRARVGGGVSTGSVPPNAV
jgi:hypothetical protein